MLNLVLAVGLSCVQTPPRPQDPVRPDSPRPESSTRGSASIDPELKTAVDAFTRANSYRFHADGHCPGDLSRFNLSSRVGETPSGRDTKDEGRESGHARDRDATANTKQEFKLEGTYQRGKPLLLMSDAIEAYRSADKIAYKTKSKNEWTVVKISDTGMPGVHGMPDGSVGTDGQDRGNANPSARDDQTGRNGSFRTGKGELEMLPLVAHLPAPNELLDNFESQTTNCTRVDSRSGSPVFECTLEPEFVKKFFEEHGSTSGAYDRSTGTGERGAAGNAAPMPTPSKCTLRITLAQNRVDQIVFESQWTDMSRTTPNSNPNPESNEPRSTTGSQLSTGGTDAIARYTVMEIGKAEVTVPDEVTKLLGGGR